MGWQDAPIVGGQSNSGATPAWMNAPLVNAPAQTSSAPQDLGTTALWNKPADTSWGDYLLAHLAKPFQGANQAAQDYSRTAVDAATFGLGDRLQSKLTGNPLEQERADTNAAYGRLGAMAPIVSGAMYGMGPGQLGMASKLGGAVAPAIGRWAGGVVGSGAEGALAGGAGALGHDENVGTGALAGLGVGMAGGVLGGVVGRGGRSRRRPPPPISRPRRKRRTPRSAIFSMTRRKRCALRSTSPTRRTPFAIGAATSGTTLQRPGAKSTLCSTSRSCPPTISSSRKATSRGSPRTRTATPTTRSMRPLRWAAAGCPRKWHSPNRRAAERGSRLCGSGESRRRCPPWPGARRWQARRLDCQEPGRRRPRRGGPGERPISGPSRARLSPNPVHRNTMRSTLWPAPRKARLAGASGGLTLWDLKHHLLWPAVGLAGAQTAGAFGTAEGHQPWWANIPGGHRRHRRWRSAEKGIGRGRHAGSGARRRRRARVALSTGQSQAPILPGATGRDALRNLIFGAGAAGYY